MEDLLFLAHRIPYPPDKGDKIRSWNILRFLAERYRVHLGCFIDDEADWAHTELLRSLCAGCQFARLSPEFARFRSLRSLAAGEALSIGYYRDPVFAGWVDEIGRRIRPKRVFVFSSQVAQFILTPAFANARRIVDFVDVDSDKWRQYATSKSWPMSWVYRREARTLQAFERRIVSAVDVGLFVSAPEAALFRQIAPEAAARVAHVDNGVDQAFFDPDLAQADPYDGHRETVVFTGAMDYWANVDAVTWFADEVLPRLIERRPTLRFAIVGSRPTSAVLALAKRPNIIVTGRVPDIRAYVAHAAAVVAPLRLARGVQNKVLEAMSMAKATVVSPQALEGIVATAGQELLVADSATAFADAVLDAMAPERAAILGALARRRILSRYTWAATLAPLAGMLEGQRAAPAPDATMGQKALAS
ncbi:MAG: TIGR03087 family PEP-CTERM/XrtA system glycosyltransferase [Alphaproteobacteria bacterium]